MATTAIIRFTAKEGMGEDLTAFLKGVEPVIAAQEGNSGVKLLRNEEHSDQLMLVEHWTSADAHRAFQQHLQEQGVMQKAKELISGLEISYFQNA